MICNNYELICEKFNISPGYLLLSSILFSNLTLISYSHANPLGGQIVGGAGAIHRSGTTTTIHQNTNRMAIDWQSYNLNQNERVQYLQPDSSSISLNRILGNDASTIRGKIDANGQVILVNPNGVFFGPNATVNVGGLIASGLDINTNDFMNGNFVFNEVAGRDGVVINSGIINAATGGSVSLIGKQVKNDGLIAAKLGMVNLAAGKTAVVTFDKTGLLGIKVTKEVLQNDIGLDPAVINNGQITAEGGKILLTASVSQDLFSRAVNTGSLQQATSAVVHADGTFTLGAGADVINTGTLDVSAQTANQNAGAVLVLGNNVTSSGVISADVVSGTSGSVELHASDTTKLTGTSITTARATKTGIGGSVKVLGNKVGLFDQASVDVSGANGGGVVLIGGDKTGKNSAIRNADFIYLGKNTTVKADATNNGNGGKIITFANDTARIYGNLFARGGLNGGNGGFIETSGLRGFDITNAPDVSAAMGSGGEWLIDPFNITILDCSISACTTIGTDAITGVNPFEASANNAELDVQLIYNALNNSNNTTVTITTDTSPASVVGNPVQLGDITLATNFDYQGNNDGTLQLNAANNIVINNFNLRADNSTGKLNFNLNADWGGAIGTPGNGIGDVKITNSRILTNGGAFSASGVNFTSKDSVNGRNIRTNGGDVTLNMTGLVKIGSDIFTNGGTVAISGTAGVTTDFLATSVPATTPANFNYKGNIDTSNNPGGGVNITSLGTIDLGGTITTDNGDVSLSSSGVAAAGKITVRDTITTNNGRFTVADSSQFETTSVTAAGLTTSGNIDTVGGTAGVVNITSRGAVILGADITTGGADVAVLNSGSFVSDVNGTINTFTGAGSVSVLSSGRIGIGGDIITDSGTINLASTGTGSVTAGEISVTSTLLLTNGANINIGQAATPGGVFRATRFNQSNTSVISTYTNSGNSAGGNIAIASTGTISTTKLSTLAGAINLESSATSAAGLVTVDGTTYSNGGAVSIVKSGAFTITTNGSIETDSLSPGGDIVINSTGAVKLNGVIRTHNASVTVASTASSISSIAGTNGKGSIDTGISRPGGIVTPKTDNTDTAGFVSLNSTGSINLAGAIRTNGAAVDLTTSAGGATVTVGDIDTGLAPTSTLSIASSGAITANGVLKIGSTTTIANTGVAVRDSIILDNIANDFGSTVALTNGTDGAGKATVSIKASNGFSFATSQVGQGLFRVETASGDIRQAGDIKQIADPSTSSSLTATTGNIILARATNDFEGNVVLTAGGDITLQDINSIALGTTALGGNLTVTANSGSVALGKTTLGGNLVATAKGVGGDISQAAGAGNGIDMTGVNSSARFNVDGTHSITLANSANKFQSVSFFANNGTGKLQDITVANSIGLDLQTLDLTGNLDVTTVTGNITSNQGSLTVAMLTTLSAGAGAGNITLGGNNNFNDVVIRNANDVSITDINDINIGDDVGTQSSINGNLNLRSNGNITQTALLKMNTGTTATLNAGIGNIQLSSNKIDNTLIQNDFDNIVLNATGDVSIADSNGINIGDANRTASIIGGNLTVVATGDIKQTAAITMNAGTVADFTAGSGVIDFGILANNFDVINLSSSNAVSINDIAGGISLGTTLITGNGSLTVDTNNAGAIGNVSGDIVVAGLTRLTAGNNDVNLTAGNHDFSSVVVTAKNVSLSDISGINLGDDVNKTTEVSTVTGNLTVSALGDVTDLNGNNTVTGTSNLTSQDSAITMVNTDFGGVLTASAGTDITIVDATRLELGSVSALANIDLTAGDNITGGTVSAERVQLVANKGINTSTSTKNLFVENRATVDTNGIVISALSGDVVISNTGLVVIESLKNVGNITLNNDDSIRINPGSIDSGYNATNTTLRITLANGSFIGNPQADPANPIADMTAYDAIFNASNGNFGSLDRPLVLSINNYLVINSKRSFKPTYIPRNPREVLDTSTFQFSFFDAASAIAGEQLIEVEELEDVDPAIFSDVRNYTYGQIAIRLPRDQLFDDELEVDQQ